MDRIIIFLLLAFWSHDGQAMTSPATVTTPNPENSTQISTTADVMDTNVTTEAQTTVTPMCVGVTCENNGTCNINGTCDCLPEFTGSRCQYSTVCALGTCVDRGTTDCTVGMDGVGTCHCKPTYLGNRCETFNMCTRDPCQNNGTCHVMDGQFSCTCITGAPDQDCKLNKRDECTQYLPRSFESFFACIDLIERFEYVCAPGYIGNTCQNQEDLALHCNEEHCQDIDYCKPQCNVEACNGTKYCNFTAIHQPEDVFLNNSCKENFLNGYYESACGSEVDLFDGFDEIRGMLSDCSPFFDTICSRNFTDGICNPICNHADCLWDGGDCLTPAERADTMLHGFVVIQMVGKPDNLYNQRLAMLLRSVLLHQEASHMNRTFSYIKVGNTNFTNIKYAGRFVAEALTKLPNENINVGKVSNVFVCEKGQYMMSEDDTSCSSNCSATCAQTGDICNPLDGKCLHGCVPSYWGEHCEYLCEECNSTCNATTGDCLECYPGKYGAQCDKLCDMYCIGGVCDVSSGKCPCITGRYWRDSEIKCEKCGTGCTEACDPNTGYCTCKSGWYGNLCSAACSVHCKLGTCDGSGVCDEGCEEGYYSNGCTMKCKAGCASCSRASGDCEGKCEPGYSGNTCERIKQEPEEPETDNAGVIAAVFIAIAIVIIIVAGAICYWKKRKFGDYRMHDDLESPVREADTMEVRNNQGMQPTTPGGAQPGDMIDMEEKPSGVYAGPPKEGGLLMLDADPAEPVQPKDSADTEHVTSDTAALVMSPPPDQTGPEDVVEQETRLTSDTDAQAAEPAAAETPESAPLSEVRAPLASEENILSDLGTPPPVPSEEAVEPSKPEVDTTEASVEESVEPSEAKVDTTEAPAEQSVEPSEPVVDTTEAPTEATTEGASEVKQDGGESSEDKQEETKRSSVSSNSSKSSSSSHEEKKTSEPTTEM